MRPWNIAIFIQTSFWPAFQTTATKASCSLIRRSVGFLNAKKMTGSDQSFKKLESIQDFFTFTILATLGGVVPISICSAATSA